MILDWKMTRVQWGMAVFLAAISGYVDGYGLLFLKTFVSFMSGNTTSAGLKSGQGDLQGSFLSGLAIVFFVSGSFLGNLLSQFQWRHCHRLLFGLIATGLALVNALELAGLRDAPLEIALLCVVMGMMNPALSKIGTESVSLTFMTGTLSRIGGHLALAAVRKPLEGPESRADSHLTRAGMEASVWAGFLAGAVLSGIACPSFRKWALLLPCAMMLALGLLSDCVAPAPEKANSLSEAGFCPSDRTRKLPR